MDLTRRGFLKAAGAAAVIAAVPFRIPQGELSKYRHLLSGGTMQIYSGPKGDFTNSRLLVEMRNMPIGPTATKNVVRLSEPVSGDIVATGLASWMVLRSTDGKYEYVGGVSSCSLDDGLILNSTALCETDEFTLVQMTMS